MNAEQLSPRVLHRTTTDRGELVLRRVAATDGGADHFEIISNGMFLMDTRDGGSERALVREALAATSSRAPRLLIGGLGVGFSLREALLHPPVTQPGQVTVVEIEPTIVAWHETHLAEISAHAVADPRVRLVVDDVATLLRRETTGYDAICLDVDNGPGWTVTDENQRLYADAGLALLCSRLTPGGVLAVWSAHEDAGFQKALTVHFDDCRVVEVATTATTSASTAPDLVYLATRSS